MSIFNFRFVDTFEWDRGAYRKENVASTVWSVWWGSHSDMALHSILAQTIFRSLLLNSLAYFLSNFSRSCFRFLDDLARQGAFGHMLLEICSYFRKASLCHLLGPTAAAEWRKLFMKYKLFFNSLRTHYYPFLCGSKNINWGNDEPKLVHEGGWIVTWQCRSAKKLKSKQKPRTYSLCINGRTHYQ